MATTIKIKSTTTVDKAPTTSDIQVSELALNLTDLKLFSRNSTGIFEIGKAGRTPSGNTASRPSSPSTGDLYFDTDLGALVFYDGASWVPVSVDTTVDLAYTPAASQGTITNTAGTDAVLPLANGTNAGLSLNNFSATDVATLGSALQNGDNVSELVNDAGYLTQSDVSTAYVQTNDGGTQQSITGGGGLDVAGGITSEFGNSTLQLGNVAPLNDWSCYPARV